jgi:hypothetical protein
MAVYTEKEWETRKWENLENNKAILGVISL